MKILEWDTETSPNTGYVWGLFKQNLSLPQLVETSRLLCVCARWQGESRVIKIAEWEYEHRLDFLQAVFELLDEADGVISYNGKSFDTKVVMWEFAQHIGRRPSPYVEVDLYQVVKSNFRPTSGKLDHVSQKILGERKLAHTGFQLWVDCMNGCPKAQKLMLRYCAQDVKLLRPLYESLRPWINTALSRSLENEAHVCPECGSRNLHRRGYYSTKVSKFQRYECNDCGKWSRGRKSVADASQVLVSI